MTPALCLFFSLIFPGAGQIYAGDYAAGVIIGLLFALGKSALLPLSFRVFKVNDLPRALAFFYVCNCGYIALICGAAAGALWRGFQVSEPHFLYAFLFAFAGIAAYKNTFNKFIFTALCGREGVWEAFIKTRKSPTEKK